MDNNEFTEKVFDFLSKVDKICLPDQDLRQLHSALRGLNIKRAWRIANDDKNSKMLEVMKGLHPLLSHLLYSKKYNKDRENLRNFLYRKFPETIGKFEHFESFLSQKKSGVHIDSNGQVLELINFNFSPGEFEIIFNSDIERFSDFLLTLNQKKILLLNKFLPSVSNNIGGSGLGLSFKPRKLVEVRKRIAYNLSFN